MKKQNSNPEDAARLRQKAEEKLKERTDKERLISDASEAEMLKLIHELQVHQIELELQNEELVIAKEKAELAEEKYTELYDFAPSGYVALSKEGEILELNFAAANMLGKERTKLIKRRFGVFVSIDTRKTFNQFLLDVFTGNEKQNCEVIIATDGNPALAGQALPIYVNIDGIVSQNDELCFLTLNDITERIRAKRELQESEEKYRISEFDLKKAQQIAHLGSWALNIETNELLWSDEIYKIFDCEPQEFEATYDAFLGFIHPDDREKVNSAYLNSLETKTEYQIEHRIITKNNQIKYVREKCLTTFNEQGKPLNSFGIVIDITESKQAEEALQERTELLQNITNHMFDMVAITDLTGVFTYAGPSHRILGFEPEQLLGTSVFEYLHPEDANYVANEFREFITDPSPETTRTVEYRQRCLDGSYLWLETIGKILFNSNGTPSSLFFSSRNVTERKLAEEAIRKSEADLKQQTRLQKLLMDISNTYINVGEEDLDQTINKSLAELGEFMGADRCYIFEYDYDRQVTNNTHEWCADGIEPQIDKLQTTPLELFSVWLETNQKDETVYIHDILKLPEGDSTRNFLESQGIKSLIAVPITDNGICTGFIGFDSVQKHHVYTKTEDKLLRVYAQMLVSVKKRLSYEHQIHESHEKYQIVAENTISWEFWEAPNGEFLYHSPSCEKIIGRKAEDLLKNPGLFFEMIHPDDLKAYNIHRKEGRKHNGLRKHYFRIINSKGETRNIEHQCLLVYGSSGAYLGIRGSNVDITERRQAEEAILQNRQRLESLLEISRSITSTLDQEKIMQMVVDNAIRIMGLGSGAIYLQNDEETIKLTATSPALPDDFPDVFRIASLTDHPHIAKTIATGSYQLLADSSTAELSPAEQEIVKLRGLRSNLYLPISLRDKMIGVLILSSVEETYHFADEEIQLLQGFANQVAHIIFNISHFTELKIYAAELEQQISQRKQIEKALRESEHFANSIANHTPALIYLFDLETGANLWSNNLHKRFFSNLDAHDSELAMDEISQMIHPEDLRVLFDKKAELSINKDIREFQHEIRINEKGTWKWMNSLTSVFKRDEQGKITQILGVLFDIDDRKKAEEAIKQNEERFRQVAETNQTVIWEINTEGIYTYVSPMAEKIWGYTPEELVNKKTYYDLHPEEGRQVFIDKTMKFVSERNSFNDFINPIQKRDGSIIWVTTNGLPVFDEHRNLTGYRGSDQDITERILAEKELRKFKTISDQANYGAAIADLNGKLLYVNDQFAQMHGWKSKDLIHESLNILHNEQQLPKVNELLQVLKAEGSFASKEVGHVRKDGSVFPTLMNASIIYDEHNLPIFMASTVIDITEITAAKLELLKLTQAVVQNPASIIITDPEGSIEYTNPRFIEMMGYEAGEVIGEKSRLFLEGVMPDEMQKELLETIRKGHVWKGEFRNTKKNGEAFWENVSISPIKNETGDIVSFLAINEDISERMKLLEDLTMAKEKAEESDKLKTHFMNNISHEVRTPLNGILGFGDIMMQEGLTRDERLVYHKILKQSSNRLMKTIDDIMDISLINEGLIKPMLSPFLLPDLLESFIDRLKENCASGNIFVSLEIPPDAKDMVIHSDREMLGKILWQLLSNAAKFTSQGKINYGFLNLKNETQFYVKDTGQGIAADKLEVIFKPFVQEDVSTTRGYEGSGLGITIARGLVEVLGGKLWVESKKSKGTSVFFNLPIIRVEQEKEPVVKITPRLQVSDNPVVLIAEDDEFNYQLMKAVIRKAGYSTLHAYNGADAVELCHKFPEISLVFMDMKMPVMHGLEATALIKAFRPELPVVAVTAYAQTGDRQKMLQAGCDEYLAKPVKVIDLKDMIKKMLC